MSLAAEWAARRRASESAAGPSRRLECRSGVTVTVSDSGTARRSAGVSCTNVDPGRRSTTRMMPESPAQAEGGRAPASAARLRPELEMIISKLGSKYWLLLVLPPIIGNYWLLLQLLAIIGYYFLQKVFILLAIIATNSNINYCKYCDTIIAIIGSASKYWHYWQLLAIIDINSIIGINLN
jgi:hypothetical protein